MSIYHASTLYPITHSHVFSLRPPCFLHVPWCHIFNLHYTCTHHMYHMRNLCPLTSSLTLTPFRLFLILLDPKFFQTILASVTWLPGHMPIFYPFVRYRLIIIILIYVRLTLTLAKVCPHTCLIIQGALTVLLLYLYKLYVVHATTMFCFYFCPKGLMSILCLLYSDCVRLYILP